MTIFITISLKVKLEMVTMVSANRNGTKKVIP